MFYTTRMTGKFSIQRYKICCGYAFFHMGYAFLKMRKWRRKLTFNSKLNCKRPARCNSKAWWVTILSEKPIKEQVFVPRAVFLKCLSELSQIISKISIQYLLLQSEQITKFLELTFKRSARRRVRTCAPQIQSQRPKWPCNLTKKMDLFALNNLIWLS